MRSTHIVQGGPKQAAVCLQKEHCSPGNFEVLRHLQIRGKENGQNRDFMAEHGEVEICHGLAWLKNTAKHFREIIRGNTCAKETVKAKRERCNNAAEQLRGISDVS